MWCLSESWGVQPDVDPLWPGVPGADPHHLQISLVIKHSLWTCVRFCTCRCDGKWGRLKATCCVFMAGGESEHLRSIQKAKARWTRALTASSEQVSTWCVALKENVIFGLFDKTGVNSASQSGKAIELFSLMVYWWKINPLRQKTSFSVQLGSFSCSLPAEMSDIWSLSSTNSQAQSTTVNLATMTEHTPGRSQPGNRDWTHANLATPSLLPSTCKILSALCLDETVTENFVLSWNVTFILEIWRFY